MNGQEWRILISCTDDAALNLAIDESLIRNLVKRGAPSTIRVWQNRPSIIIGRSQDARAEVNIDVCRRLGIPVIRRFSGGGTVYTDKGCYNYTVVTPTQEIRGPRTLQAMHGFICSAIMNVISRFGSTPLLIPPSSIFVLGRKVSGSAQYLLHDCLLQHGTLLVDSNLGVLRSVLSRNGRMAALLHSVPSTPAPVANLAELIGRHPSRGEVYDAMIHELTSLFGQPCRRGSLSSAEDEMARRLLRSDHSASS
ncbi:MAG: hypothetical protein C4K49_01910 [Candidatus Thorarchaeota archaeon]|nr:MAG: hypothetical protein C4K49_01910 [Candidatus Thorarchaeota archaeon]